MSLELWFRSKEGRIELGVAIHSKKNRARIQKTKSKEFFYVIKKNSSNNSRVVQKAESIVVRFIQLVT